MKKIGLALVMATLFLFAGAQAYAQQTAGPAGNTPKRQGKGCPAQVSPEIQQKFLTETASLREDLAAKRGEYRAVMAHDNPDSKIAGELSREIFKLQEQIRIKASALGLPCGTGGGCGMGKDWEKGSGQRGMNGKGGCRWQQ